jgi:hypothetical protein
MSCCDLQSNLWNGQSSTPATSVSVVVIRCARHLRITTIGCTRCLKSKVSPGLPTSNQSFGGARWVVRTVGSERTISGQSSNQRTESKILLFEFDRPYVTAVTPAAFSTHTYTPFTRQCHCPIIPSCIAFQIRGEGRASFSVLLWSPAQRSRKTRQIRT